MVRAYSPGRVNLIGDHTDYNGLPVFPVYYANDDDGERGLGADSRVHFTAPEDGSYLVRVTDARGHGGERFAYRLVLRAYQPQTVLITGQYKVPALSFA